MVPSACFDRICFPEEPADLSELPGRGFFPLPLFRVDELLLPGRFFFSVIICFKKSIF